MRKVKVLLFVAIAITVALLYVCRCHLTEKTYKAQCSFRLVDPSERVIERGDNGTYQDFRIVVRDGLIPFLKGGSEVPELLRSYSESTMAQRMSVLAVSNAFASANYRIEDEDGKVVRLVVSAESPELALDVNNFILTKYAQSVRMEDISREDKALAKMRSDIRRKRLANEDVSELLIQLDRARTVIQARRREVTIIAPPRVVGLD